MQKTAYHFEGAITVGEEQAYRCDYIQCPFEVPENTGLMRLRLQYSPLEVKNVNNLITLGLFDSAGFRGNAHRHPPDNEVILSADAASPGFVAGHLSPGRWLAQLAVHCVLDSSPPCHYVLDIEMAPGPAHLPKARQRPPAETIPAQSSPTRNGPGWYIGELHSHTLHSDGSLTSAELVARAREQRLDFLAVTDHNTTTALGEIDPAMLGSMLLIPGMELTTFTGHALVLGLEKWVDWRTGYNGWTMDDAARAARAAGGLFIIAHPGAVGSPVCTGCQWEYPEFNLDLADGFEVWNGPSEDATDQNPKALAMWRELMASGRRMPATGGADFHGLMDWRAGTPRVAIYAQTLSVPAILDGIRLGRMIITSGPRLSLQVRAGGADRPGEVGDTLAVKASDMEVTAGYKEAPESARLIIRNPHWTHTANITGEGSIQRMAQIEKNDRVWAELYDRTGTTLLAITNPVFISKES